MNFAGKSFIFGEKVSFMPGLAAVALLQNWAFSQFSSLLFTSHPIVIPGASPLGSCASVNSATAIILPAAARPMRLRSFRGLAARTLSTSTYDLGTSKSTNNVLSALFIVFQHIEKCTSSPYRTFRCTILYDWPLRLGQTLRRGSNCFGDTSPSEWSEAVPQQKRAPYRSPFLLRYQDSNLDWGNQNPMCCHYTIPQSRLQS